MPKGKIQIGTSRKTVAVTRKFKLGGRKSTKSALHTSTVELQEIVAGSGRAKAKLRARNELVRRNAPLVAEIVESEDGTAVEAA